MKFYFCAGVKICYNGEKINERGLGVEVPEKIIRRRATRLEIIFIHTAFAGGISRAVYIFDVELHGRGDRLGANSNGNVYGLALEFEDGGRGNVDSVCFGVDSRLEFANTAWNGDFGVADFLNAFHAEIPLLSSVSIDVRA